jgi:hypothetical protein
MEIEQALKEIKEKLEKGIEIEFIKNEVIE